ncbi:MAG: hypothetical protein ABI655_12825 [Phenylobacterium sp.]
MSNTGTAETAGRLSRGLRSVLAVLAGFAAVVILSTLTDMALVATGLAPPISQSASWSAGLLLLASLYRTVFDVVGGYVAASLAPSRPVTHALVLGAIGMAAGTAGAIVMREAGPAWYAWSLVVLALPATWAGARLQQMFLGRRNTRV